MGGAGGDCLQYDQDVLADHVLLEVNTETTVRGLWEKLEKMYMGKNMMNKL